MYLIPPRVGEDSSGDMQRGDVAIERLRLGETEEETEARRVAEPARPGECDRARCCGDLPLVIGVEALLVREAALRADVPVRFFPRAALVGVRECDSSK